MDSYTRTVVNLTVLGKIQDHERLTIDGGLFSIEHVPNGAFGRVWRLLRRTFTNQSRATMLTHLEFLARDSERFLDDELLARVPSARRGIESLRRTYVDDIATTSTLEFIDKRFENLVPPTPPPRRDER